MVTKERQAVEDEVEAHQNTQSSVNKTVRNLNKVGQKYQQPRLLADWSWRRLTLLSACLPASPIRRVCVCALL